MKLTKYEHACFTVEAEGSIVVVDPGSFTTNLGTLQNVIAVIITHEHPDHFDIDTLVEISRNNPSVSIFGPSSIIRLSGDLLSIKPVTHGQIIDLGPFHFEFFAGSHAVIHTDIPVIDNIGVLINDTLYYPGDSFILPGKPVDVLALPISAPWLKLSEAIDFARSINPRIIFPTHDAPLSDIGNDLVDRIVPAMMHQATSTYQRLTNPIEI
jgi:L-ascorbate metabolism protein UlaG (beta-lactamase superfamily)